MSIARNALASLDGDLGALAREQLEFKLYRARDLLRLLARDRDRLAGFLNDPQVHQWMTGDPEHWLARKIREHLVDDA